jgi:UDP-N-acetylglucosamine--N-acetylmuramyl-(pentapeptide) pyrophosphoryl-undecaprenol N-acetylglucosamine transferase
MKILVSAAKTGGHIFPAIAVGNELKSNGHDIVFIGSGASIEISAIKKTSFSYHRISMEGFRGKNFLGKIKSLLLIPISIFKILKIIKNEKVDAMIGFGGFITVPVGIAFLISRKPIFIHEQNAILGSANKMLGRFSKIIFSAFKLKETFKNICITGNPIREEFRRNIPQEDYSEITKIYITGGSQGSDYINTNVPVAFEGLSKKILIKHQCGKGKNKELENLYKKFNIDAEVKEFYENPESLISWSDFVISRAGALSVSEVTSLSKGLLMIPLPSAIDNHQLYNAKHIEDLNMGLIHEEKDGLDALKKKISTIVYKKKYNTWKINRNKNHLESASIIAGKVIEYIEQKK